MEARARGAATNADAEIVETIEVPGSYDTPLAADRLARRDDGVDVVALGAIVTGDTEHNRVIADATPQTRTSRSSSSCYCKWQGGCRDR